MNLYIENIASTSKTNWISIYEVIRDDYFKAVKLFPTQFLDHCKKKKEMNLKTYQVKSKYICFKWLLTRVVCRSGNDKQKKLR